MKCPKCQFENREEATFCRKCGSSLKKEIVCQYCCSTNSPDSRFCEKCGQDLRKLVTPGQEGLKEIERRYILSVLEKTNWRLTGKGGTAEILGLKRSTLQSKMKKLGITRPKDLPI
jgi:transcriptional regulator with GAF, ATPase, and Fis domain